MVVLETIAVPALGPGEVLVRIDTCGVCGTDLKKIHTDSHPGPRVFGHEMVWDGRRGGGRRASLLSATA